MSSVADPKTFRAQKQKLNRVLASGFITQEEYEKRSQEVTQGFTPHPTGFSLQKSKGVKYTPYDLPFDKNSLIEPTDHYSVYSIPGTNVREDYRDEEHAANIIVSMNATTPIDRSCLYSGVTLNQQAFTSFQSAYDTTKSQNSAPSRYNDQLTIHFVYQTTGNKHTIQVARNGTMRQVEAAICKAISKPREDIVIELSGRPAKLDESFQQNQLEDGDVLFVKTTQFTLNNNANLASFSAALSNMSISSVSQSPATSSSAATQNAAFVSFKEPASPVSTSVNTASFGSSPSPSFTSQFSSGMSPTSSNFSGLPVGSSSFVSGLPLPSFNIPGPSSFGTTVPTSTGFGATFGTSPGLGGNTHSFGATVPQTSTGFGSTFGTSGGFGALQTPTTGFSGSAFGAPPQASSGFGALTFGGLTPQTQTFSSGFGASQTPSTGFGGTSGGFGALQMPTTGFGGSAFGASPASSGFGTSQTPGFVQADHLTFDSARSNLEDAKKAPAVKKSRGRPRKAEPTQPFGNNNNNNNNNNNSSGNSSLELETFLTAGWYKALHTTIENQPSVADFIGANRGWVIPSRANTFKALQCNPEDIKVVIFGQDPYPREQSANGIAFFDAQITDWNNPLNPSLKNIIKSALITQNLCSNTAAIGAIRKCLRMKKVLQPHQWFQHTMHDGVLWLNTALTFSGKEKPELNRHTQFWAPIISEIIKVLLSARKDKGIVFVFWGDNAKHLLKQVEKHKRDLGVNDLKVEICSAHHPAVGTFFQKGSPLTDVNAALSKLKLSEVNWLPSQ